MRSLVIGGAGFIGSHLVERLVERGPVTIFDDLSVGRRAFVQGPLDSGGATLVVGDALDFEALKQTATGHDVVFHLAANPEARRGLDNTRLDLEQGTIATHNALEAARLAGIPRFVFASSGTVYGERLEPCSELDLGLLPVSLYGASKLACEAMVSAFAACFELRATIMRFGNVVGPRGTHGAALDFLRKLKASPDELEVLGDGNQSKPYLHVNDCVDGLLFALDLPTPSSQSQLEIFNLAPRDATSVRAIAELCVARSPNTKARIRYTGGARGWRGDVPFCRMTPDLLAGRGFRVRHTSDEAVALAVEALAREVFA